MLVGRVSLDVSGLGIILYSPAACPPIAIGEDYLTTSFMTPEQVAAHANNGTIAGFGTGSPGRYTMQIDIDEMVPASAPTEFQTRTSVKVAGGRLCARDLYDLLDWNPQCPSGSEISCPDGLYEIQLRSERPSSGIVGDDQVVYVYLIPVERLPVAAGSEIPLLYRAPTSSPETRTRGQR